LGDAADFRLLLTITALFRRAELIQLRTIARSREFSVMVTIAAKSQAGVSYVET
jgi:hypothetical protein